MYRYLLSRLKIPASIERQRPECPRRLATTPARKTEVVEGCEVEIPAPSGTGDRQPGGKLRARRFADESIAF